MLCVFKPSILVSTTATFMSKESDIACNPITSFQVLHASEPVFEKPVIDRASVVVLQKNNPSSETLVYALLDTQSDTVIVEQEVSKELQADFCPVS